MRRASTLLLIFAISAIATHCSKPSASDRPAATSASGGVSLHFNRTLLLETMPETSANVSFGDVDGDGNLDIVLAKGRHWPLVDRVLIGDGKGGVVRRYDLGPAADRSYSGSLVDLDGDGDLDVVISNDAPDAKRVYLNDGAGHFAAGGTFGDAAWETRNATIVDVNGDGLPDIVVANRPTLDDGHPTSTAANFVCVNQGGGRFAHPCVPFSHEPATTIAAADVNGDGLVDLIVPYRDRGQSHVYLNAGGGHFSDDRRMPFGPARARIRMAEAVDLDGDRRLDIVAIDEEQGVLVFYGTADGFSAGTAIAGPQPIAYALAVANLPGASHPSVIVGHVEAPSTVFLTRADGRSFVPLSFGDAKGTVYGFAVGDFDKDGVPDIAAARSDAPNILYFGSR